MNVRDTGQCPEAMGSDPGQCPQSVSAHVPSDHAERGFHVYTAERTCVTLCGSVEHALGTRGHRPAIQIYDVAEFFTRLQVWRRQGVFIERLSVHINHRLESLLCRW